MNILAIGAHPDDIEYGCAGTLIKYRRQGHKIYLCVVTNGAAKDEPDLRKKEQLEAARLMDAEDVFFLEHTDTEVACSRQLIMDIEDVARKVQPDFAFVPYPDDTHQDHRALAQAAIPASRSIIRNVLYFEGFSSINFNPTVYVDIGDVLEYKLACLEAHKSQVMNTYVHERSIVDVSRSTAHFRGIQARVKSAEAFSSMRLFINI
ncbi:MAG: LmbE family N-acetylglucosaminyl deacetylase [Candidatus Latescibacterota bacterium]|jgi:LmbE family N-acetylglucosaminyl deacetylase